jgi:hypothetical protein
MTDVERAKAKKTNEMHKKAAVLYIDDTAP